MLHAILLLLAFYRFIMQSQELDLAFLMRSYASGEKEDEVLSKMPSKDTNFEKLGGHKICWFSTRKKSVKCILFCFGM